jgi:hypothetical protein
MTTRHAVLAWAGAGVLVLARAAALGAQAPMNRVDVERRSYEALRALDRYQEGWNSQDPLRWAGSLHFPHIRPGPGAFELTLTPEEYAAGVDFSRTRASGWHHSEWTSLRVLQVDAAKVHVAGEWRRYDVDGNPMIGSAITYVVTEQDGRWGIQARFAAGQLGADAQTQAANGTAALYALDFYIEAWNGHDPRELAEAQHYPFVRVADGDVEISRTPEDFLLGPEPGRQRTWFETRLDQPEVVQATANGVNVVSTYSRRGRDGSVFSRYEALFLVVERQGVWKVQAVSTFGP